MLLPSPTVRVTAIYQELLGKDLHELCLGQEEPAPPSPAMTRQSNFIFSRSAKGGSCI